MPSVLSHTRFFPFCFFSDSWSFLQVLADLSILLLPWSFGQLSASISPHEVFSKYVRPSSIFFLQFFCGLVFCLFFAIGPYRRKLRSTKKFAKYCMLFVVEFPYSHPYSRLMRPFKEKRQSLVSISICGDFHTFCIAPNDCFAFFIWYATSSSLVAKWLQILELNVVDPELRQIGCIDM